MLGRKNVEVAQDTSTEPLSLSGDHTSALIKLTGSFLLLVLLTFVTVEGWRAWRDYRQAYATAQDSVTNLSRAMAQHAEDAIRQVEVMINALSERVEGDGIKNIDVERIHTLMQQQAQLMPQLHGIFIYGTDGTWIVTDKETTPKGANNSDRDYFVYHRTHTDPKVRIGQVIESRSTKELIIPISRRLNNADGSFAGVLLGTIRVSYFVDYYGDFKIDDRGSLVLTLRDGTILVRRPFNPAVIGQTIAQGEIYKRYLPYANEGVAEAKAVTDGTNRLYGYRALTSYPLIVVAGLSRESFVGPWKQDLLKTGLVLLALIGGLAGFGFVVMYQLRQRMAMENEIRRSHQAVRDMALTDSLTGLGNRRKLDMVLTQEIARARRQGTILALIMIDIDFFKRFNDRYGHSAGDDCLQSAGKAIQSVLKRPADLAIRYGGEEFIVLLPETDSNGANTIAEGLLENIRAMKIEHADHPLGFVTASAGVAIGLPGSEEVTASGMIKTADAFLYMAKNKGRNRWQAANGDSDLERLMMARKHDR